MSVQWSKNPKKIGGGTRVLVPGHQNSGARYVPDCLSVGAFCKADIYAKSKGEQLSTFSEKMYINDLTFGQFFAQIKYNCYLGHEKE